LPNGNLYVNLSRRYQYEVDLDENLVWQYSEAGSKGFRVTCAHPGVQRLISDGVLDNTFCDLSSTDEIFVNPYTVSPNPSTGIFKISDIVNDQSVQNITVTNSQGELILKLEHDVREINLTDFDPAIYFLSLNYTDRKPTTKRIILTK